MLMGAIAKASIALWETCLWAYSFNTVGTPGTTSTLSMEVVATLSGPTFWLTPYLVLDMDPHVGNKVRRCFTERLRQYGVETSPLHAEITMVRVTGDPWSLRYKTVFGSPALGCVIFRRHTHDHKTCDWVVQRSLDILTVSPHVMMLMSRIDDQGGLITDDDVRALPRLWWHYSKVMRLTTMDTDAIRSVMVHDLAHRDALLARLIEVKEMRCAWDERP